MTDETRPGADASTDRLIYAGFPRELREAMKSAAQRGPWTRDDWRLQTPLIHDALIAGRVSADDLADAYRNAPPLQEAT